MAKKKVAAKKIAKKAAVARPIAKKKTAVPKTRAAKKGRSKSAAREPEPPSLGRPLVTSEEKLYFLFHEDYHARQIFEYLRAETVRDLEQFTPDEIVRQLSQPIKQTVERIRRKLAEKHRSLKDDQAFALKHNATRPAG